MDVSELFVSKLMSVPYNYYVPETKYSFVAKEQIPVVDRITYNEKTTVVFWKDGTKTVVRCAANEDFTEDGGFCAALAKKIYGGRSQYMKLIKNAYHQLPREKKEKKSE